IANWQKMRRLRDSAAFKANTDPAVAALLRTPDIDLYAIDVSFSAIKDPEERAYLNDLPTSFVLPAEAVDRLRAAAGKIILDSPDFLRLLKDTGARVVAAPGSTSADDH
ncbi:MAG TPA: patatin-like phospholipase family protein, partial [Casimicrobiaceae bacterium]